MMLALVRIGTLPRKACTRLSGSEAGAAESSYPVRRLRVIASMLTLLVAGCRDADETRVAAPSTTPRHAMRAPAPAFAERRDERRKLAERLTARGVRDHEVLRAMQAVPRHAFVAESWATEAYADRPVPIGHGQTMSQPTVVAFMTEAARPRREDKCLEVGTGSGYHAAVLAELCGRVYSIEYLAPLAMQAERTLRGLGYGPDRIELRTGDGYQGWAEAAPFQVVLVTAAPEHVPQPLLDQLAVGGRLVIPVGPRDEAQRLERHVRTRAGKDSSSFETSSLMLVRFVPFSGDDARVP